MFLEFSWSESVCWHWQWKRKNKCSIQSYRHFAASLRNRRRLNNVGVHVADLPSGTSPTGSDSRWLEVFFQASYLGDVEQFDLEAVATHVMVCSYANQTSNLLVGGNSEPGILAVSEVEVYGTAVSGNSDALPQMTKTLYTIPPLDWPSRRLNSIKTKSREWFQLLTEKKQFEPLNCYHFCSKLLNSLILC